MNLELIFSPLSLCGIKPKAVNPQHKHFNGFSLLSDVQFISDYPFHQNRLSLRAHRGGSYSSLVSSHRTVSEAQGHLRKARGSGVLTPEATCLHSDLSCSTVNETAEFWVPQAVKVLSDAQNGPNF